MEETPQAASGELWDSTPGTTTMGSTTGTGADDTGSAAAGQGTGVLETTAVVRSEEPHSWHTWAEADIMVATT